MKKIYLLLLLPSFVFAQVPNNTTPKFLDKNRVNARMHTVNNKFWQVYGNNRPAYEVPRGKGTHAQFGNSIWIGGLDKNGLLHMSANTYRQNGVDFWPGPLDTANIGAFTPTATMPYNQLWKVDCDDINAFAMAFYNGSVAANTYAIPPDILNYPAKGIDNFQKKLEPFHDPNNDGIYNPAVDGGYPLIKGHQQILSIFNDNLGLHTETNAPPMGLEIHERAYAYSDPTLPDSMQAVNYTTFYHYTIYNRSEESYSNVFISDWSDVDLGNFSDDFIGTDTINNFTYCYNGDALDQSGGGTIGYGNKPPVVSHAIIQTPYCTNDGIDNDADGIVDEAGEHFILNRSSYYMNNVTGANPATINPGLAVEYYNYMTGFWKDGSPFTYGGTGYGGTASSKYVYPGNPATNSGWTETSAGNTPGDRRVLSTSGPFFFPAKSKIEWGYAIVFSQDTTQAVNTITQFNSRVQRDVRNVKYYDQMHQAPQCVPAYYTGFHQSAGPVLRALVYPNPAWNTVNIQLSEIINSADIKLMDISGRTITQKNITNASSATLDIQDLDAGVYFVEVNAGNASVIQKVIKSR